MINLLFNNISNYSSFAQKIGLPRMSFNCGGINQSCRNVFIFFISPCLEYCSPVWCSAADCHLLLLDRNLNAIRFLIPGHSVDLWHRRSSSFLCILFKICCNLKHPLYSDLPGLFHPARITKGALSSNNLAFSVVRFNTAQFCRSFIPAVAIL